MSGWLLSRRQWLATGVTLAACPDGYANPSSPPVTAITFAPDGKFVLAGSQAGVLVRACDSGVTLRRVAVEMAQIHDLVFSPDGKTLAIAGGTPGESGVVELIDWPSGQSRQIVQSHDDVVYQVDFAGDGSKWITASADEVCCVFDSGATKPAIRLTKHSRAVLAVQMLPDAKTAVSASRDETLRVWDVINGENLRTMHNHSRDVNALALQRGGQPLPIVASASADMTIRLWQPTIGRMVRFARLPAEPLAIGWAAGGEKLVAVCRDGALRVIDPVSVEISDTVKLSDGWLYALGVDPNDDRRIAIGGANGLMLMHRIA